MTSKKHFPIYLIFILIFVSLFFEIIFNPKKSFLKEELKIENRKIKTITGEEYDLIPTKGVVVLNFFATWCNPCIAEFPALEKLYRDFKDKNLTVIGIWSDGSKEQLTALQNKLGLTIPIVDDNNGDLNREFGITGFPETFVINKDGVTEIYDRYEGQNEKRIVGPRPWSSSSYRDELSKLLNN